VGIGDKNMSNLPVGQPGYRPKDNKYQPAKLSNREREGQATANKLGYTHEFNIKGKVIAQGGSYHDFKPGSGSDFNSTDKHSSLEYLRERGKKGVRVDRMTGGQIYGREHTGNIGQTVYPSEPINQVYSRATSNTKDGTKMDPKYNYKNPKDRVERKGLNLDK
jgi:hypothetical protein